MNVAGRKSGQHGSTRGGTHFSTRGWFTPSFVGLLCLGMLIAAYERGHGNFHKLKTRVDPPPPAEIIPQGPGGQDPIRLTRSATSIGKEAELISATFLPGRGMNVFQITALLPGHGEVALLASPPLSSAAGLLNGLDEDANGSASTSMGGAILAPWAQTLSGTPTNPAGTPASTASTLQTSWNGQRLSFPAMNPDSSVSVEGLLLKQGVDTVKSDVLPDGQSVTAVFHAGSFSGSWPSTLEVNVQANLTSHDLDLTITETNTGQQPTLAGVGWHPLFAIPSGDRSDALVRIPSKNVVEVDRRSGRPTGKIVSTGGSENDYSRLGGTRLGVSNINETYTNLEPGVASGPVAEIRDPAYNFKLSVIPLTASITNMRVIAPTDHSWVSIGPNTNFDDPLGAEWGDPQRAGMVMLAPGATLRWKVRVEISLIGSAE
jgi:aldose 1-epimerase